MVKYPSSKQARNTAALAFRVPGLCCGMLHAHPQPRLSLDRSMVRTESPSPACHVGIKLALDREPLALYDLAAEDRCRNILVRYCAHIPRNYQYRDGIKIVFLILRDHLGDQSLGLAGGVLYELIEIDCPHSDDAGAAFQRWRHDHMNRHLDLELPHIPHLTTITSTIKPSSNLVSWRERHSARYLTRLSDFPPSDRRASQEASCIKSRKAWAIEHTMYVSTRDGGTSIFRTVSPGECHRVKWDTKASHPGRLVQEKEFVPRHLDRHRDKTRYLPRDTSHQKRTVRGPMARVSLFLHDSLRKVCGYQQVLRCRAPLTGTENLGQPGWYERPLETPPLPDTLPVCLASLPEGHIIPHPIFARKFALISDDEPVPRTMTKNLMPTADSAATSMGEGRTNEQVAWNLRGEFRGPFTPQLGFDGGRDFEWSPLDLGPEGANSGIQASSLGLRKRVPHTEAVAGNRVLPFVRSAHDWFGLDAELPRLIESGNHPSTTRQRPYCKMTVHGYNWFGLD